MLLAQCTGDSIVATILPFIQEHFKNPNWRYMAVLSAVLQKCLDEVYFVFFFYLDIAKQR